VEQKSFGSNTGGIDAPFFDGSQICAQTDPDLFFPDSAAESQLNLKQVRPLCRECEFKTPCLEYALKFPDLHGIWAGTTETERKIMRRYSRRTA